MGIKVVRLALCSIIALVSVLTEASVAEADSVQSSSAVTAKTLPSFQWLLLIARQPERNSELETNLPFRNSPMALYEYKDGVWHRASEVFMSRSTSTSLNRPEDIDINTVRRYMQQKNEKYSYGYKSVPEGLYLLSRAGLEPGQHEVADDWFLISDWHTRGSVTLQSPQTIRYCDVEENKWPEKPKIVDLPTSSTASVKTDCYLHGSATRYWSHRDSKGCINLHDANSSHDGSPWDRFRDLLKEKGLWEHKIPTGMLIVKGEELENFVAGELPSALNIEFMPSEDGRHLHARVAAP